MSEASVSVDGRYWAFISYSHRDAAFGRRLHRRLEGYALPRRLVGQPTVQGTVPRRLAPIFRDRDEFPAAKDLSAEVQAALKNSRSLIVVCSPTAATSPWVAREIELFHALHPERPILAAIREGDPHDCFPEALRRAGPGGASVEPLAADFRRGHDGWELGLLKLVAGMLGIGLDELIQRDAQRTTRRVTAITAGALALVLVMAVLTVFAISARNEAEHERAEALRMIKFMQTDLRADLRGLGRMDLLAAVNKQALSYLDQEQGDSSPALPAQRAQLLQAIGEDEEGHGLRGRARDRFREAWRITHDQLAATPEDLDRLFDHAQSEYWLGYGDYERGHYPEARRHFQTYRELGRRMITVDANDPRGWRELSFAEGNLCAVALKPPEQRTAALQLCLAALTHMEKAEKFRPRLRNIDVDLSDKQSWVGTAYQSNGDQTRALEHFLIQQGMLERLMASDPWNVERRSEWIALQRSLARSDAAAGQTERARSRLKAALKFLDDMLVIDKRNEGWKRQRLKIQQQLDDLTSH